MAKPDALIANAFAKDILSYIDGREQAADTLDGVCEWWLTQQRVQQERQQVHQALEYLCASGALSKRALPDGEILYVVKKSIN